MYVAFFSFSREKWLFMSRSGAFSSRVWLSKIEYFRRVLFNGNHSSLGVTIFIFPRRIVVDMVQYREIKLGTYCVRVTSVDLV